MEIAPPRVAYFPDSFHEINGVAQSSRQFQAFAERRNLPFLCVRAGDRVPAFVQKGQLSTLELRRGLVSFALDKDLRFDPAFLRHLPAIVRTLRRFRPDVLHITGPSEIGILGAALAHFLHVPLVASWHTNVHEYVATRSAHFFGWLPQRSAEPTAKQVEALTLAAAARFYSVARILTAPNPELCALLEKATHRPCFLMPGGVDTNVFSPAFRDRPATDKEFVLGYVGRLSVEKNIALLAAVERSLLELGLTGLRFLIVGQGAEEGWLRQNLPHAEFAGVLRGDALARAYANMDLFLFPSHTDTFGNVVLEALSSGVPAIVTPDGGPQSIVQQGQSGFIATDDEFAPIVARIMRDPALHAEMRLNARAQALGASWDAVFEGVYSAYETVLKRQGMS